MTQVMPDTTKRLLLKAVADPYTKRIPATATTQEFIDGEIVKFSVSTYLGYYAQLMKHISVALRGRAHIEVHDRYELLYDLPTASKRYEGYVERTNMTDNGSGLITTLELSVTGPPCPPGRSLWEVLKNWWNPLSAKESDR